jgi:hypothetical protein
VDALGAVLAALRAGHGLGDQVGQGQGGGERPVGDDRLGDAPGVGLLAVLAQDALQLGPAGVVDQRGGGGGLGRVHAHVERAEGPEREPTAGGVQLHRGDAEVVQDAHERAVVPDDGRDVLGQLVEGCTDEVDAVAEGGEAPTGQLEGVRVAVEPDQVGLLAAGGQQPRGVAGSSQGAVEEDGGLVVGHGEQLDDAVDHDGVVWCGGHDAGVDPSSKRRARPGPRGGGQLYCHSATPVSSI